MSVYPILSHQLLTMWQPAGLIIIKELIAWAEFLSLSQSLSINENKHFIYYLLVIFLFSVQVRKVVMDTMKNIHPIYNIKVC